MADEEQNQVQGSNSGGGGKLIVILGVVNLLATFGIIGLLVVSFQKSATHPRVDDIVSAEPNAEGEEGAEEGAEANAEPGEDSEHSFGKMVTLDQFTVNLSVSGGSTPKFARVNISLEVGGGDTESEIVQKMPRVRNIIIDLFNSKRPNDLATPEGRSYLKDEIRTAINSFLVTGKLSGVFFTNFALSS